MSPHSTSNGHSAENDGHPSTNRTDGRFLLHVVQQPLPLRDFRAEVRAQNDLNLLRSATVLLDLELDDLDEILERMVGEIVPPPGERLAYADVRRQLLSFTDCEASFRVPSIRQRVQSIDVDVENAVLNQNWVGLHCSVDSISKRQVCVARLKRPLNFGLDLGDVQHVCLVVGCTTEKNAKSSLETARTISTLFSDPTLRNQLAACRSGAEVREALRKAAQWQADRSVVEIEKKSLLADEEEDSSWFPGRGVVRDFRRRWQHYKSDYLDGVRSARDVQKTISSAVFLYFSILPTAIALGMLNDQTTGGKIGVRMQILSQIIGGLVFGVAGGQLFLILLSTAPIAIFIGILQHIADSSGVDFFKLYTTTGLWCSLLLLISALTEMSRVMKFARRSLEELFGLFISLALVVRAFSAGISSVSAFTPDCEHYDPLRCERAVGLLFWLLMIGTLLLSVILFHFRSSPYLFKTKRDLLSDYALPVAVVVNALVGILLFGDVPTETFSFDPHKSVLSPVAFWSQGWKEHLICFGLGIPLAILFFMDQLIVTNTVDNNQNQLKKGAAANWDLLVVALLNAVLSLLGLPWMHGALPQAFLHLRALADVEDRLVDGVVQSVVVKNRETRCATLIAHAAMIPTYFWLLPYLQMVPTAVFNGLFLYLACTSTVGNEFCERVLLLFTEQRAYPPVHYLRRVPQRQVHMFTLMEVGQLALLCFVGIFAPWPELELGFPIITFLFIPFRSLVLPLFFERDHLEALDGVH